MGVCSGGRREPACLADWRAATGQATLYNTAVDGAITVTFDGREITVQTYRCCGIRVRAFIPAQAGIQAPSEGCLLLDSRLRGNDGTGRQDTRVKLPVARKTACCLARRGAAVYTHR